MIASIQKNAREELRISLDEFNGHELVNVRVWFDAGAGEMRPGKQGIALRVDLLPKLIEALNAAQARRQGA